MAFAFHYIDRTSYLSCVATYSSALRAIRISLRYATMTETYYFDDARARIIQHYLDLRAQAKRLKGQD